MEILIGKKFTTSKMGYTATARNSEIRETFEILEIKNNRVKALLLSSNKFMSTPEGIIREFELDEVLKLV